MHLFVLESCTECLQKKMMYCTSYSGEGELHFSLRMKTRFCVVSMLKGSGSRQTNRRLIQTRMLNVAQREVLENAPFVLS